MQLKISLISFVIGALATMNTCTQAVPIEVIYTGDSCDCPKKLNYLVNVPIPRIPKFNKPSEHGYNLEYPLKTKAEVTYSFDFMVEEPKKPLPPPEVKWDLSAKIDRITAHKNDCLGSEIVPNKSCGCRQHILANRNISPESSAARFARNLKHPNSIDNNMEQTTSPVSHIMAIIVEPLEQTKRSTSKSRRKRDILSNIFMRPRKNEKRSDRLVKQYNTRLKDVGISEHKFFDDSSKSIKSRAVGGNRPSVIRPLQQLSNFLTLPSLRNKRDIKGEYDLIEKEREEMDLTLPEIIQYMPETLDPNFKRDQCQFGQRCRHSELAKSTTKTPTTKMTSGKSTKMTMENRDTLETNNADSLKDEEQKSQVDNAISSTHAKRNIGIYGDGGCPTVLRSYNPTPPPRFTYEPLTNFEAIPRPFASANNPHGPDPAPQQYVGASYNPYSSAIFDKNPSLEATYGKSSIVPISNNQLDRIIGAIISKHSDFIEASSHQNGALVDPPKVQEEQAKYFLKNLIGESWKDWSTLKDNY